MLSSLRRHLRRFSTHPRPFDPPPAPPRRRVVVTGLGLVTPLGCGLGPTWSRLVEGQCGVRAITADDLRMDGFDEAAVAHTYEQLSSKVAAVVPRGKGEGEFDEEVWLQSKVCFMFSSLIWELAVYFRGCLFKCWKVRILMSYVSFIFVHCLVKDIALSFGVCNTWELVIGCI